MAWIHSSNPAHAGGAFKDGNLDEPVRFTANGTAQVSNEEGDYLVSTYDDFSYGPDDEDPDDGDTDAEADTE